jgi:hypothetical protein
VAGAIASDRLHAGAMEDTMLTIAFWIGICVAIFCSKPGP